jgi:hypothetical protein
MKIKDKLVEILDNIYLIGVLVILSPLLIFMSYCFCKDKIVRGNGE